MHVYVCLCLYVREAFLTPNIKFLKNSLLHYIHISFTLGVIMSLVFLVTLGSCW